MDLRQALGHGRFDVRSRRLRALIDRAFDGGPELIAELLDAFLGVTRDRDDHVLHAFLELLQLRSGGRKVHLVGHDDTRLRGEDRGVEAKFAFEDAVIIPRLAIFAASHVDDEDQERAALDVTKELVAEAAVLVRTFDESRNIGHHDAVEAVGVIDYAHVDVKGRERIRCHLRAGGREEIREGRLTRVGVAHEADVGDRLEHDAEATFFARVARSRAARGLVDRALEVHVAHTALAAGKEHDAFAVFGQLGHETIGAFLEDLRTRRHRQDQVAAIGTRALAALARSAIAGATVRLPAVGLQIAFVTVADQHDVAALAAVTAVGSALRDEFLTTEADAAVAAVTGLQFNLGFVDKHFSYARASPAPRARRKGGGLALQPAGTAQPALDR